MAAAGSLRVADACPSCFTSLSHLSHSRVDFKFRIGVVTLSPLGLLLFFSACQPGLRNNIAGSHFAGQRC